MAEYTHPESLVDIDWVAQHGTDPRVRLIEVNVDSSVYGHGISNTLEERHLCKKAYI